MNLNDARRPAPEPFRLGQILDKTGLTARQVREWERRKIICPGRGVGNQRVYDAGDVTILLQAKSLREAGLGLEETRNALKILNGKGSEVDGEALRQIRAIAGRVAGEIEVIDRLCSAVIAHLDGRAGSIK